MKKIEELRNVKLIDALQTIKEEIVEIAGDAAQLLVYGSYARGEEREDSDVDLMVILPDEKSALQVKDEIRNLIYDAGFELDMHFSVMVVSESQARKHAGFMVFGGIDREGIAV